MTQKKVSAKRFLSLSPAERDREVAKFDRDIDLETNTRPLNARERAAFERWRREVVKASKTQEVKIQLDAVTLLRCKVYAEKHQLTLSEVVNLGLTSVFRFAE